MNGLVNKYKNILIISILGILNVIVLFLLGYECPWKKNFDIDCAGCGATRMFISLLHLEIYQAFRYNPLIFCLLVLGLIYLIYLLICRIIKIDYYKLKTSHLWILLVLVVLFTIIRNVPGFEFLKPTKI